MDFRDVNFRQFDAFSAVMAAGSITGAAKMLGCSQPTITRLIREFESALGFELLHRSGPRVSPTERALKFHQEVEGLMVDMGRLQERVAEIREEATPRIHIAATPALAVSLVPGALARLAAEDLPQRILLSADPIERVIQSVVSRKSELGVASFPIEHASIETHWLAEAPCVAILPIGHPLGGHGHLRVADLKDERLIAAAHPFRHRTRIDRALQENGVEPNRVIDTNASITAISMARAGLGVAIVEPATAYGYPVEGVEVCRIDAQIPFYFGAISPVNVPLSPAAEAFIPCVRDYAAAIIPGIRFKTNVAKI
ncbi:LysR family transcriptional regulator [Aureimonas fodinaquatilis]|uniref:LysR family transcriptional regulator n=1 Tax=Aureimonas fodinaquatilis TaxID=2565783 RepID=A0A5B0DUD8_9HYPH|nr:LysR family transcriptional regulator [Aureimonas fodinaquatilis]KAA0970427.1 LysR family transcriptional regulator [Aureimonas fodinaquatilis]